MCTVYVNNETVGNYEYNKTKAKICACFVKHLNFIVLQKTELERKHVTAEPECSNVRCTEQVEVSDCNTTFDQSFMVNSQN